MKRLHTKSQNFLRNPLLVKELIGHSNLKKSDTVYDIGAGSGVITSVLARRVNHVVAIEPEAPTAEILRANTSQLPNVEVREADILTMDLPQGSYKVFSNIPFHISSPIVRKLTEAVHSPEAIYLIVQKQFANKIVLSNFRFTAQLGIIIGPLYTARIRKNLQRTDFQPMPNVDTVLLELVRRDVPLVSLKDMPRYRTFIEGCFSDPRKFVKTPREEIGLSVERKPSEVTLEQWIALFEAYGSSAYNGKNKGGR